MPTVIDITPVSSRTSDEPPQPLEPTQEQGRAAFAWARLKRRLLIMAITLGVIAAVVVVVSVGLLILLALLGVAAVLTLVAVVRGAFGKSPGTGIQSRG